VVSAENAQETIITPLGKPRGLKVCCTRSVQSRDLRKWLNKFLSIVLNFLVLLEDEQKISVGV